MNDEQVTPSYSHLAPSQSTSGLLPTPFAAAGVGLLVSSVLPGGLTGGEGFLLGFVIGLALTVAIPLVSDLRLVNKVRCPNCGTEFHFTRQGELDGETRHPDLKGDKHVG